MVLIHEVSNANDSCLVLRVTRIFGRSFSVNSEATATVLFCSSSVLIKPFCNFLSAADTEGCYRVACTTDRMSQ